MMPLHLSLGEVPFTIVDDNARIPSEDLLDQSSPYRRKRKTAGMGNNTPVVVKPVKTKPSRWDPIPVVSKKLVQLPPKSMPRSSMSLNDCARMTLRMPARWRDDSNLDKKLHKPLKRPSRSAGYADAATILELALAEVDFPDDIDNDLAIDFDDSFAATI